MLDGKMLRDAIGTPMRRNDRANSRLALADPEPLTLANLMTKSFVASIRLTITSFRHVVRAPPPPVRGRRTRAKREPEGGMPGSGGLGSEIPRPLDEVLCSEPPTRAPCPAYPPPARA